MTTWRVPFKDQKTAALFYQRMQNSWEPNIIEIDEIVTKTISHSASTPLMVNLEKPEVINLYEWENSDLIATCGDDNLFDLLSARTTHYKKPFDMRPCIKEALRPILQSEKELYQSTGTFSQSRFTLKNINLVREAVGLAKLKPVEKRSKSTKLLRSLLGLFGRKTI